MQLKKEVSHCKRLRTVFAPSQKATAVIIRGIVVKFKMLLYFDFDIKMDFNLLLKLITEVEERAGVWVVYDKSHCLYCVVRTETRLK